MSLNIFLSNKRLTDFLSQEDVLKLLSIVFSNLSFILHSESVNYVLLAEVLIIRTFDNKDVEIFQKYHGICFPEESVDSLSEKYGISADEVAQKVLNIEQKIKHEFSLAA